ncbi:BC85_0335 family putative methyltransferase [Mesomycoplasma lagogenitalium]|uniref:Methyltransferase n=1 Tax=Mesomycoplasma lagogenitalium TaxID=171286 RepID=A0ABY8LWD1_9BACT|nr:hypothetical protein [Mesomycoplasma lagogenitalium]WGI36432.1 hypothetical protein QEG99_03115 [Mesomycoplasma lagogenitalium]
MNETVKWILIASIFIVLAIGFSLYFFFRFKAKQEIKKYQELNKEFEVKSDIKMDEKIKDNIQTTNWVVDDFEFIINTISHNNYYYNLFIEKDGLAFSVVNYQLKNKHSFIYKTNDIEKNIENVYKNTNFRFDKEKLVSDIDKNKWDFIFINNWNELELKVKKLIPLLNENGMIMIKDLTDKKVKKNLIEYLEKSHIKHQFLKYTHTFLLIVV